MESPYMVSSLIKKRLCHPPTVFQTITKKLTSCYNEALSGWQDASSVPCWSWLTFRKNMYLPTWMTRCPSSEGMQEASYYSSSKYVYYPGGVALDRLVWIKEI